MPDDAHGVGRCTIAAFCAGGDAAGSGGTAGDIINSRASSSASRRGRRFYAGRAIINARLAAGRTASARRRSRSRGRVVMRHFLAAAASQLRPVPLGRPRRRPRGLMPTEYDDAVNSGAAT